MFFVNTDETLDELGEFRIIQKKNGYRFSDDSVQLANFVLPLKPENSVIDLGAGSGVISLILAQRSQIKNIVGVEIQEGLADIAERNVVLNNLSSQIKIVKGDFRDIIHRRLFKKDSFSVVISNPPYTKEKSGRISPSGEKRVAKMEITCTLSDLIKISKYLAAKNGRLCYTYPVARLQEMLFALRDNDLKVNRLQFIYPKPNDRAKRFLIEAVKR
jgi:tRNA1Val (adenine37-N6)-methyltransferase